MIGNDKHNIFLPTVFQLSFNSKFLPDRRAQPFPRSICTIKDSPQLHFFVQKGTNLFQLDGNGSHNLPKWPWICHLNCSANSFWGFIGSSFWAVICCHIGRHKATTSCPECQNFAQFEESPPEAIWSPCIQEVDRWWRPSYLVLPVSQNGDGQWKLVLGLSLTSAWRHVLITPTGRLLKPSNPGRNGGLVLVAHTTKEWAKRNAQRGGRDERLLKEVATHVQKLIGLQGPEMGKKLDDFWCK